MKGIELFIVVIIAWLFAFGLIVVSEIASPKQEQVEIAKLLGSA